MSCVCVVFLFQGLPKLTIPAAREAQTAARPGLPPLQGPLHLHAQRAMGMEPTTLGGGQLLGALRPHTLPPINQSPPSSPTAAPTGGGMLPPALAPISPTGARPTLAPPISPTGARPTLAPPLLPGIGERGKGPLSGKPYPKKGSPYTSSDENIDSDSKEPGESMPSLAPIKSPAPLFPGRRPLPQIGSPPPPLQTLPSLPALSKPALPSMPPRRTSMDPFSPGTAPSSQSPAGRTLSIDTAGRSPPTSLTFQRPTGAVGAQPLRMPKMPSKAAIREKDPFPAATSGSPNTQPPKEEDDGQK